VSQSGAAPSYCQSQGKTTALCAAYQAAAATQASNSCFLLRLCPRGTLCVFCWTWLAVRAAGALKQQWVLLSKVQAEAGPSNPEKAAASETDKIVYAVGGYIGGVLPSLCVFQFARYMYMRSDRAAIERSATVTGIALAFDRRNWEYHLLLQCKWPV
jgi:hypothetical protein